MDEVISRHALSHQSALKILSAGVAEAERIGIPQCIVLVDAGGNIQCSARMDGAKFLSLRSATAKAITAASSGRPSGGMEWEVGLAASLASKLDVTNLPGGLPIYCDGELIGGIGVGSGAPEEDLKVAHAALSVVNSISDSPD